MAEKLSEEKLQELKDAFDIFDKDKDGSITVLELGDLMRGLGHSPTDAQILDMIRSVDANNNSQIDFDEFISLMTQRIMDDDDEMLQAFNEFDKDRNGFIDKSELKQVMGNLGVKLSEDEAEEMMKVADINNDGQINFEEFKAMIGSK